MAKNNNKIQTSSVAVFGVKSAFSDTNPSQLTSPLPKN